MSVEIRVPQLPESVADATLSAWHKEIGQPVQRDENLADLETDKVMLEIPAPVSGVLREIKVQPGTTVKSGAVLALIEEGAAATAVATSALPSGTSAPASSPASAAATGRPASAPVSAAPAVAAPPTLAANGGNGAQPSVSGERSAAPRRGPAARRVLEENQLSAGAIAGGSGRISKADAVAAVSQATAASAPAPGATERLGTAPAASPVRAPAPAPAPRPRRAPRPPPAWSNGYR